MRAVIYARFSTDKQSDHSIEDQARNCERYAQRWQMQVLQRFEDKAISGQSKSRPGFQRMLDAAERGEFDVLLVDDLSRLSRDDVEMKQVIRRFKFRRTRIVGVSDGYDSATKGEKIQSTMRGLMNEMYIDDLREKTHRGLYGKVLNGFSAGGRSYGYDRDPIISTTRRDTHGRPEIEAVRKTINEDEAKWVRQIFKWFADGYTIKWIVSELNRQKIPSPRGNSWSTSAVYGDMTKGSGMLNNRLYIGEYAWNRSEWIKNPDTGKRTRLVRGESEWVVTPMPELRIVPQELWEAVKARQADIRKNSAAIREALSNPNSRSHTGKYLFSGLLKCDCCGSNFTAYGQYSFACAANVTRGESVCSNRIRVTRELVESILVDEIQNNLFSEENVDAFVKAAANWLREIEAKNQPDMTAIRKQIVRAEKDIATIMTAIKAGIITSTTKDELLKAEAAKESAEKVLKGRAGAESFKLPDILPNAIKRYKDTIKALSETLRKDIAVARQHLKILIGPIKLQPTEDGILQAILKPRPEGLFLSLGNPMYIRLVAGVGFEPTTFRL